MNIDEIFMLDPDATNYEELSDTDLYTLISLDKNAYVSTNSLSELFTRKHPLAYKSAKQIWDNNLGDDLLKAMALTVIYEFRADEAIKIFFSEEAEKNIPALESMTNIYLIENLKLNRNSQPLANLIKKRIDSASRAHFMDIERINEFNETYKTLY